MTETADAPPPPSSQPEPPTTANLPPAASAPVQRPVNWPFSDGQRSPARQGGRRTGYRAGMSQISFDMPQRPTATADGAVATPQRQPRFRHASPQGFVPPIPYANDFDNTKPPIPRPLVKVVLVGPSPSYEPKRLARVTLQPPDGLLAPQVFAGPEPTLKLPVQRYPQFVYEYGWYNRDPPYSQTPGAIVAYTPPRMSTRVTTPYPMDHVYLGIADPRPAPKITSCARRPKATPDHVKEIFAELPTIREYQSTPREAWLTKTPYGTDLVREPLVGRNVRSVPFCVSPPKHIPAAPPGRLQRSKGTMAPDPRPKIIGFDLD
jgi:hypothetical protein